MIPERSARHAEALPTISSGVQLFHYHLVTSKVREVEARYLGKLGFNLIARHGRVGEDLTSYEPGVSWAELDASGFKLRLSELERGAVNIVVQPGQWPLPRVDHLGLVLDDDEFDATIERAERAGLRVQEHGGRRTFVSTNAGYRLELHPPRDWIDELLAAGDDLRLAELELRADDPAEKAEALASVLDLPRTDGGVQLGPTTVRFVPGGPQGRPELYGELFV
jgi:catechol 2,3-dioxygenase-like lactoylglutathione lyase family enzyme